MFIVTLQNVYKRKTLLKGLYTLYSQRTRKRDVLATKPQLRALCYLERRGKTYVENGTALYIQHSHKRKKKARKT